MATIDDFHKIEMKVGTIISTEEIEGSDKLLKLKVDFGEESPRQVLSGIKNKVSTEALVGKQFPFVTNLEPRKMMGLESQAMILGAGDGEVFALFNPTNEVPSGTKLK
ncbi:MAG: methionine--tRNA ligase subunit beta [Candidatus Zambryskibacteria bacterium CG10_big_fil_rev_8_21_14_0_10_42_12]|uniref:Methionine--tRNA ligase n=1 Tax=Candidatus Zambryskibacteria bacterium CG10_big_fil_rev_8_21_14_0_10_42_12 TaxID=1975115 RepID=A0A2H0QSJ3_9BACT|nr:MAG: methionine--tRNA ligase subunit beta [Candidatus Zambryskibacteria bacterium CG10_big_fil_rev_8_21_14_0_10_42_12]